MSESSSDPLIGTPVLGGYVIRSVLGQGGMGSVYLAEHERIGRKVAVKVLHPHMTSNRDIVARFLAEARAASALDHPNIIEVLDAATLDDGRAYIALEFLHGEALDDYLRARKQLDLTTALHILVQTCCGLEAAHHRGIVHRDLKPANLFVSPTELDPLRTKVLDFGIAKLTDTVMAGDVKTGTNAIAGTPGYMPPEQARGMRDVDHRADLYSLGAVAYRMVSGALPYVGDSLGEIIYQQLAAPPPDVRTKRADLPEGWAHAIMACLGTEPSMRPPSARHFAFALAEATPGGHEILRSAAPLFFSDRWIELNNKLIASIPASSVAAPLAAGGTATYRPQALAQTALENPPASPATTLSSAAGYVQDAAPTIPPYGQPQKKKWPVLLASGGASAAAIGGIIAIVGSTMGGSNQSAASDVQDAAVVSPDAEIVATAPPAALPDAAPVVPVVETPRDAKKTTSVSIELDISPRDAFVEIDGVSTRDRTLKLKRDSKVRVVVSKRGYKTERRELTARTGGRVSIDLSAIRTTSTKSKPETSTKKTETGTSSAKTTATTKKTEKKPDTGPISTELGDAPKKKPVGPTTNTLE